MGLKLPHVPVKDTTQPTEGTRAEFLVKLEPLWSRRRIELESAFSVLVRKSGGWGNAGFI